jgi:predicted metal-dependent hydrolase
MNEWYRSQLKTIIPELIAKWEEKIGVRSNDWRVKSMTTRWGSCSILAKRIWLNLELAKKPRHAIEYVIAHELTHLIEKHHNERFMGLMDEHFPTWRSVKAELNEVV